MPSPLDEVATFEPPDPISETQQHGREIAGGLGLGETEDVFQPTRPGAEERDPLDVIGEQEHQLLGQLGTARRGARQYYGAKLRDLGLQRHELERHRREGEQAERAQAQAERAAQAQADRAERLKATDLKERGIPSFRDAQSGVTPVTDETGAPLLHYDPHHGIAYDSSGNPRSVSYESLSGPPVLRDPFEGIPPREDFDTGDIYQERAGLPWRWVGADPTVKNKREQEEKDKAIKTESGLLGQKISLEHAQYVAGETAHKQLHKDLTTAVPELLDPKYEGADRDTVLKGIDDHFNTEYAHPSANQKTGLFHPELTDTAKELRSQIDTRKADTIDKAHRLFDLKDKQLELSDRLAGEQELRGTQLDTLIAHGRGELGPMDQPHLDIGVPPHEIVGEPAEQNPAQHAVDQSVELAKAGKKPYKVTDDNKIVMDATKPASSLDAAVQDGLIDSKWAEEHRAQFQDVENKYNELQKVAGSNQVLKALLAGGGRGAAFAAGAGVGGEVGAEVGGGIGALVTAPVGEAGGAGPAIGAGIGAVLGGLTTGTLAAWAAGKGMEKLADYNNAVKSLMASAQLHPTAETIGELGGFALSPTRLLTKGLERTAEGLTVVDRPLDLAPTAYRAFTDFYKLGRIAGTAEGAFDAGKAARVVGTQLGIRALSGATFEAVIRPAFDAATHTAAEALGIPHDQWQAPTVSSILTNAALGIMTAAHTVDFQHIPAATVGSAMIRAKLRADLGIGLDDASPEATARVTNAYSRLVPGARIEDAQAASRALDPNEINLWTSLRTKVKAMGESGAFDQARGIRFGDAEQATIRTITGQQIPIISAEVEPVPREPPPAAPGLPAPPPTEGGPADVRTGQPEVTREEEGPPTKQPERGAGPPGVVRTPVPAPGEAPPTSITPVPGGAPAQPPVAPPFSSPLSPSDRRELEARAQAAVDKIEDPGERRRAQQSLDFAKKSHQELRREHDEATTTGDKMRALIEMREHEDALRRIAGEPEVGEPTPNLTLDQDAHGGATSPTNEKPHPTPAQAAAGNYEMGHTEIGPEGGAKLQVSIENPQGSIRSNFNRPAAPGEEGPVTKLLEEVRGTIAEEPVSRAISDGNNGNYQAAIHGLYQAAIRLEAEGRPTLANKVWAVHGGSWATEMQDHYGRIKGTVGFDKDHVDLFIKPGTDKTVDQKVHVANMYEGDKFDEHKAVIGAADAEEARALINRNYDPAHQDRMRGIVEFPDIASFKEWAESSEPKKGPIDELAAPAEEEPVAPFKSPALKLIHEGFAGSDHPDPLRATMKEVFDGWDSLQDAKNTLADMVETGGVMYTGRGAEIDAPTLAEAIAHVEADPSLYKFPTEAAPEPPEEEVTPTPPAEPAPPTTIAERRAAKEELMKRAQAIGKDFSAKDRAVAMTLLSSTTPTTMQLEQARGLIEKYEKIAKPPAPPQPPVSEEGEEPRPVSDVGVGEETPGRRSAETEVTQANGRIHPVSKVTDLPLSEITAAEPAKQAAAGGGVSVSWVKGRPVLHWHKATVDEQIDGLLSDGYDLEEARAYLDAMMTEEHVHARTVLAAASFAPTNDPIAIEPAVRKMLEGVYDAITTDARHHLSAVYGKNVTRLKYGFEYMARLWMNRHDYPFPESWDEPEAVAFLQEDLRAPQPEIVEKLYSRMELANTMQALASAPIQGDAAIPTTEPPPLPERQIPEKPWGVPGGEVAHASTLDSISGSGLRATGVLKLPSGAKLAWTAKIKDDRTLVENPWNENPGPAHPATIEYVAANSEANYDPLRQFIRDPSLVNGPPVVTKHPDTLLNLLVGGHRTVQIIRKNREAYHKEMPNQLDAFGIDPDVVELFKEQGGHPALVIEFDEPVPMKLMAEVIHHVNERKAQPVDPIYQAVGAARVLSENTIQEAGFLFEGDLEATPLARLKLAAAKPLSDGMIKEGAIREIDRKKYVEPSGAFTDEGAKFARRVLLGRVIDSPEILSGIEDSKTATKLLNALGQLYVIERRGGDTQLKLFKDMLELEWRRIQEDRTVARFQDLLNDLYEQRDERPEALQRWFDTFPSTKARGEFLKLINDFLPLERGAVDLVQFNQDIGEGLLRRERGEIVQAKKREPAAPAKISADEQAMRDFYKTMQERPLTKEEHQEMIKVEKRLGQRFLVNINKFKGEKPDPVLPFVEPEKTPEVKRAPLGGQAELGLLGGEEKGGQQLLLSKKRPPSRPRLEDHGAKDKPMEATFKEHAQAVDQWYKDLDNWAASLPEKTPLVFSDPKRPGKVAFVSRETAARTPGWRVTWFENKEPLGHSVESSRPKALSIAMGGYPEFTPEMVFAKRRKPKEDEPDLPGIEKRGELNWIVSQYGWEGRAKGVLYNIHHDPNTGQFNVSYMNNVNGKVEQEYVASHPTLEIAKKAAETDLEQRRADAAGQPIRRESYKIASPKKKAEGAQGEIRFTEKRKALVTSRPPSLKTLRDSLTRTSPVDYVSEEQKAIFKPHQTVGANLALYSFNAPKPGEKATAPTSPSLMSDEQLREFWKLDWKDHPVRQGEPPMWEGTAHNRRYLISYHPGKDEYRAFDWSSGFLGVPLGAKADLEQAKALAQTHVMQTTPKKGGATPTVQHGFALADGPGAGKTLQQLFVGKYMADNANHRVLIPTESQRIIDKNFASDQDLIAGGMDLWRYQGDTPVPGRVYMATYKDIERGIVDPGDWDTIIFDEAHNLKNVYNSKKATMGVQVADQAHNVMYASATLLDKPEHIAYMKQIIGTQDYQELWNKLGIRAQFINKKDGSVQIRYNYNDSVTEEEQAKLVEQLSDELTRRGLMIGRQLPLNNLDIKFLEVPISAADYLEADRLYDEIFRAEAAKKNSMNAAGIAGMVVRGFLEQAKVRQVYDHVMENLDQGKQVIVFAERIDEGSQGSYGEGIDGTLSKLVTMLEAKLGRGMVGKIFGGNSASASADITRFQNGDIKVAVATPTSGGTGINLDDIFGDAPRHLEIMTAPMAAIQTVQIFGRINRLTTKSRGSINVLFSSHPIDTWSGDISARKLRLLGAKIGGDIKGIRPLKNRTAEIRLNDDSVQLASLYDTGVPGAQISEQMARDWLTSPDDNLRKLHQGTLDKAKHKAMVESRELRNRGTMTEEEIVRVARNPRLFSQISRGHAHLQKHLQQYVDTHTLRPEAATVLRAVFAQAKGDRLATWMFESRPAKRMKPLGLGGRDVSGRPLLVLRRGKEKKVNYTVAHEMGDVFMHEFFHGCYYCFATPAQRRWIARVYAKMGGRSGAGAWFAAPGHPQKASSNQRYYSKNVYEFFAQAGAEYVFEHRVPGELLRDMYDSQCHSLEQYYEMLRRRSDIDFSELKPLMDSLLELTDKATHIDYAYPDRSSLISGVQPKGLTKGQLERYYRRKAQIQHLMTTGEELEGFGGDFPQMAPAAMYNDWISGMRIPEIAQKYDVSKLAAEHAVNMGLRDDGSADVKGTDPVDPGEVNFILINSLKRRVGRKLWKQLAPGLGILSEPLRAFRSLLLPSAISEHHLAAATDIGAELGPMHRGQEVSRENMRPDWRTFEKEGVNKEGKPEDNPGVQFMSNMSQGKAQKSAAFDGIAAKIAKMFRARLTELERAGAPIGEALRNYFPGVWTHESRRAFNQAMTEARQAEQLPESFDINNAPAEFKARIRKRVEQLLERGEGSDNNMFDYFSRRPFKGRETFRKEKVFDDIMTGVEFGLKPRSYNPVELVQAKLAELDRSIMANNVLRKWKEEGLLRIIKPGQKVPDGWVKVNDKYGTIYAPSEEFGLRIVGFRIIPKEYGEVLNNYLSGSLYNNQYFGRLYTAWMGFASMLNQAQLGVGSAFHAGFTTLEAQTSAFANVIKDVYGVMRGNRTGTQLKETFKKLPTAFYKTAVIGDAVLNAWRNPEGVMDPRIGQVTRAAELAGAGFKLEKGLKTEQIDKQYSDWFSGHKIRAAMRSPVAFVELMAKPIMEGLVPRQKAGVFAELAWRIIEQNPNVPLEDLAGEFRQAWNRVDARLGQVRYDRLFMNNIAKNVVQGSVRAPGWSGGTIAELGGSFKDTYDFFKSWQETGSLPKDIPDRVAYTIALLTGVAAMNAALTFMFTGRKPEGSDYIAFRTGREDESGNPERFVLPTYMKDIYSYSKNPFQTLINKSHPALSLMGDIIRNKDFYGIQVRDPDASVVKQAYQSGKHIVKAFTPFWMKGVARARERGAGAAERVLPLLGVMPAPRELTQTPAQAEVEKYWRGQRSAEGVAPEKFERQYAKRQLVGKIRRGEPADISGALRKGTIKPNEINYLYQRSRLGPLAAGINRMPLEEAERVYAVASPAERAQLAGIIARKRAGSAARQGRAAFTGF